jgi:hypothetical protein
VLVAEAVKAKDEHMINVSISDEFLKMSISAVKYE